MKGASDEAMGKELVDDEAMGKEGGAAVGEEGREALRTTKAKEAEEEGGGKEGEEDRGDLAAPFSSSSSRDSDERSTGDDDDDDDCDDDREDEEEEEVDEEVAGLLEKLRWIRETAERHLHSASIEVDDLYRLVGAEEGTRPPSAR